MPRTWISATGALLLVATVLTGCATSKEELLPHGNATMLDIWNANAGVSTGPGRPARQLLDARQSLRRPLTNADVQAGTRDNQAYTRTAHNEINSQFHRLPNPDLVMYVFPHFSGTETVPVPGYSTVFSFFQRVQYAMPGERTESY